jgi:hypothetical protein
VNEIVSYAWSGAQAMDGDLAKSLFPMHFQLIEK